MPFRFPPSRATVRALLCIATSISACEGGGPKRRQAAPHHASQCREAERPAAFFYPSADGKTFAPDDPHRDGCTLLVPDHLFCCPAPKSDAAP